MRELKFYEWSECDENYLYTMVMGQKIYKR